MSVTINHQTNSVEPSSGDLSIGGSGNVGIGTSSIDGRLTLKNPASSGDQNIVTVQNSSGTNAVGKIVYNQTDDSLKIINASTFSGSHMDFWTGNTESMRIDSSGNLLVGTTSITPGLSNTTTGISLTNNGYIFASKSDDNVAWFNRNTSDGSIISLRKDGTTVGSIGAHFGNIYMGKGTVGLSFNAGGNWIGPMNPSTLGNRDNAIDLGAASVRFDDIYATNGTIQTSDRNEKQDIEALSDAEQRVAVAAKGLMRRFRWRDAVAEKGDDARIHCGIIAQDLQAAFAAEGLDAGDYAMFISSTWWETQTEVPAVEAVAEVLDEEGNVVTEAVEAKDAYTRTDTYDTQEEAPEGATERTRLGVRYSELLAFIIAAI